MRKIYLVYALAFALASCGGGDSESSSGSQVEEIDDMQSANEIIGFNNDVIDYLNDTGDKIERTSGFSEDFGRMVEAKSNRIGVMNMAFIGIPLKADKIIKSTPGIISDDFKKNLIELEKNYQLVEEQNTIINKYRKNQDYKDDNWKKGEESLAKMIEGINNYYSLKEPLLAELSAIADKAEEKVLEDHPLKDPILAAKKDINLADDLQALLFAEKLDRDAIKIAYDALEKSSLQHKEEFNDALNEQGEKDSYDSFHEDIDDYLGEVRKRLRFNRAFKTSDFNSISSDYESIIGGYNSFVN